MKLTFLTAASALTSLLAISSTAMASGSICRDVTGDLVYTTYHSDGGPCCGRTTIDLEYKGKSIKQVTIMGPGPGGGGGTDDRNPELTVKMGPELDLNNNTIENHFEISHTAMNLTLTRKDGQAPLPGVTSTNIVVSMICKNSRYVGPPIP